MATAIERLKAEIREEKRIKQALEESTGELSTTIGELEEGLSKIETDANEWQLRYETQLEKNQQLDMQARQLEEDIKNAKQSKASATVPANDSYQDMSDTSLKQLLKQLLAEKKELEHELKDYEWRLDRESKAFYRADEDRRVQMSELAHAQLLLSEGQGQKRQSLNRRQKDREQKLSKQLAETIGSMSKRNSPKSATPDVSSTEHGKKDSVSEHKDSPSQQPKSMEETGDSAAVDEI